MVLLGYFSFQPVIHNWCNKGRSIYYLVCGVMRIKYSLLLFKKNTLCSGRSRFLLLLLLIENSSSCSGGCRFPPSLSLSLSLFLSLSLSLSLCLNCPFPYVWHLPFFLSHYLSSSYLYIWHHITINVLNVSLNKIFIFLNTIYSSCITCSRTGTHPCHHLNFMSNYTLLS